MTKPFCKIAPRFLFLLRIDVYPLKCSYVRLSNLFLPINHRPEPQAVQDMSLNIYSLCRFGRLECCFDHRASGSSIRRGGLLDSSDNFIVCFHMFICYK